MISILIAGFTLGFAGSLHCVGMCGPLSLALPTWHLRGPAKFLSLLLYQFGRIITYSMLGLVFGLAGRGIYIAGIQQWFSITLGLLVLLTAAMYFVQQGHLHLPFLNRFYQWVSRLIGSVIKANPGFSGFFVAGHGQWVIALRYGVHSIGSYPFFLQSVPCCWIYGFFLVQAPCLP